MLVCCETYKFEDRCAINALDNKNELREYALEGGRTFYDIVNDVIPASLVTAAITEVYNLLYESDRLSEIVALMIGRKSVICVGWNYSLHFSRYNYNRK